MLRSTRSCATYVSSDDGNNRANAPCQKKAEPCLFVESRFHERRCNSSKEERHVDARREPVTSERVFRVQDISTLKRNLRSNFSRASRYFVSHGQHLSNPPP